MASINMQSARNLVASIERAKSKIQKIDREVLLEIGKRLVDYSAHGNPLTWHPPIWPKNYHPGHFIMNWQVGKDFVPNTILEGYDDAFGTIAKERLSHLGRWTVGHTYNFVNNVPYASVLELGYHSPQVPPQGMVGRVTIEFPQIVQKAIASVK